MSVLASTVNWTNVLVALIAGLPAIIAAFAAILVHRQIQTPSGTSIGKQVESVQHVALANHYKLLAIGGATGAPDPPEAQAQAAQVPDLPESGPQDAGTS